MVSPIKIYIVDDHDDVRQALVARLSSAPDVLLLGETADVEVAQAEIESRRPDVVLVEIKRADGRGRDVVEPKDETKKRIGRSPDDADAFNLAYAGSVHAQMTAADMAQLNMPSRWAPASGVRELGAPEGWGAGRIERGRFGGKRR